MVDSLLHGLTTPADTVLSPDDPAYTLLEQRGFARYSFDLVRARALMADAGWRRGPDGGYRNAAGEPFTIDVSTSAKTDNVVEGQAVAAQWKDAGLNTTFTVIPDRATNRDEMRATFPGVLGWPMQRTPQIGEYFISAQIPSERTRWSGSNSGGYSNPAYDALYDRYLVTLELPRRQEILADLLKIQADEAVAINLYYDFSTYIAAFRKGVHGPLTVTDSQPVTSWNVATWEIN
jgi:peptide/nickel transport system substrate-binding protein